MSTFNIKGTVLHTWIWVFVMVAIILGTGYFTFIVVSDKGKPTWDYRPAKSVPSESPYAEYDKNPHGQHIRGKEGK